MVASFDNLKTRTTIVAVQSAACSINVLSSKFEIVVTVACTLKLKFAVYLMILAKAKAKTFLA